MTDGPHRCVFCHRDVHGSEDGVAFGVRGRFLFTTCLEHAPYVRHGVSVAMKAATAGALSYVDKRMPMLAKIIQGVRDARKELQP